MKVRVKTEFKDKHTGELHVAGKELDMSIERVNEVLKVGSFIELVAEQNESEWMEQTAVDGEPEENDNAEELSEEAPKRAGGQKKSK